MKRASFVAGAFLVVCLLGYELYRWSKPRTTNETSIKSDNDGMNALPALDASSVNAIQKVTKGELLTLISTNRLLSRTEKAQIDRGCPGLTCLYQGLGITRWPETARGTRAYLRLEDAVGRSCPEGQKNFMFVKQAWWTSGKPPTPDPKTGEVPLSSVTRAKPGWYTFNYGVFFPSTKTYVWINHREYGFPANLLWPMTAYLSHSPPPLDENRPAQIYCSTCSEQERR